MPIPKVVIDTNVLISSFFGGNPRRIIDLWKTQKICLCVSAGICDEYLGVMQRFYGKVDAEALLRMRALIESQHSLLFTTEIPTHKVIKADPSDDLFINTALALEAEAIISGDAHLLDLQQYQNIPILPPKDFLSQHFSTF